MSNMKFANLQKLRKGDKVAILSPSFAAPGRWPNVYKLGLERVREEFGLVPVEYPTTSKIGASGKERANDIISAFKDKDIKGVIVSLGGDDQVTYIWKYLRDYIEVFKNNPKPFFGYSDNTHIMNYLWLNGIPSYYGGSIFTEFAMQVRMDDLTKEYLSKAMFEGGEVELRASDEFNDEGLSWNDDSNLTKMRRYQKNDGWHWGGEIDAEGVTWGGCIESIDEMLRHNSPLPTLEQFENIVLVGETSEELPTSDYVMRVFRALGERGILERIKGIYIGRPKAWEFDKPNSDEQKDEYKRQQREIILATVRKYNKYIPVIQNMDFGHTAPQIPIPLGSKTRIDNSRKKVYMNF